MFTFDVTVVINKLLGTKRGIKSVLISLITVGQNSIVTPIKTIEKTWPTIENKRASAFFDNLQYEIFGYHSACTLGLVDKPDE
jgi:hypothetical protein